MLPPFVRVVDYRRYRLDSTVPANPDRAALPLPVEDANRWAVPNLGDLQRRETYRAAWVLKYPEGGVERLRYFRGGCSPRLGLLSRGRIQGCVPGAG